MSAASRACAICTGRFVPARTGRPRKTCSDRCRKALQRRRQRIPGANPQTRPTGSEVGYAEFYEEAEVFPQRFLQRDIRRLEWEELIHAQRNWEEFWERMAVQGNQPAIRSFGTPIGRGSFPMTNAEIYERIDRLESRLAEAVNSIKSDTRALIERWPNHPGLREAAEEWLDEED